MGKRFYLEFLILMMLSFAVILLYNQWPQFSTASSLSWSSLIFFALLTLLIYFLGLRAIQSKNVNGLTQLILAVVMIKLVSCAAFIIGYQEIANPQDNWFVVPFMSLYILFTAYEVILLNRLNRASVKE